MPGRPDLPIAFEVTDVRIGTTYNLYFNINLFLLLGKNFLVKQIKAFQNMQRQGEAPLLLFTMNASFKRPEPNSVIPYTNQIEIPDIDPESLST